MRSLIDVTFGSPEAGYNCVVIPCALHVSDDDRDEATGLPYVEPTWFKAYITYDRIAQGKDAVIDCGMDMIKMMFRFTYSGDGYHKIRKEFHDYLEKTDLTPFVKGWFPDPQSTTIH
jgi:hypothetical protein